MKCSPGVGVLPKSCLVGWILLIGDERHLHSLLALSLCQKHDGVGWH
jgi:hypothetical protein